MVSELIQARTETDDNGRTWVYTRNGRVELTGPREQNPQVVEADMLENRARILLDRPEITTAAEMADALGSYASNYWQWKRKFQMEEERPRP